MKELSMQEIKDIELLLLIQFASICNTQKLRYSLGGGTLLGAIRHSGFIPWDDDIDVMMPRPDYDEFLKYCRINPIPFAIVCHEDNPNYKNLFAKAIAKNTTIEDSSINIESIEMGVHIDIFPIDGLGKSYREAVKQFKKSELQREILNAATWERYFKSKTHAWYFEPIRFLLYLVSRFVDPARLMDEIDKINRAVDFETSQYAGCVSGVYRQKEIMESAVFKNYTEVSFENFYFKAIKEYAAYLKQHYGDYMQLPPEEKRITHHTFRAYTKEEIGLK